MANPRSFLPILTIAIIFLSCQAEVDPNIIEEQTIDNTCKVNKIVYYDEFGVPEDSVKFYYSGERISGYKFASGDSLALQYNNSGQITKRYIYSSSDDSYDTIYYNSGGNIIKNEIYYPDQYPGEMRARKEFHYTSGKLTAVNSFSKNAFGDFQLWAETLFAYTNENVTRRIDKIYMGTTLLGSDTTIAQYDNQPSYLNKIFSQPYLSMPTFSLDTFEDMWSFSQNNLIASFTPNVPSAADNCTYELNNQGFMTAVRINGITTVRLSYQCQ